MLVVADIAYGCFLRVGNVVFQWQEPVACKGPDRAVNWVETRRASVAWIACCWESSYCSTTKNTCSPVGAWIIYLFAYAI